MARDGPRDCRTRRLPDPVRARGRHPAAAATADEAGAAAPADRPRRTRRAVRRTAGWSWWPSGRARWPNGWSWWPSGWSWWPSGWSWRSAAGPASALARGELGPRHVVVRGLLEGRRGTQDRGLLAGAADQLDPDGEAPRRTPRRHAHGRQAGQAHRPRQQRHRPQPHAESPRAGLDPLHPRERRHDRRCRGQQDVGPGKGGQEGVPDLPGPGSRGGAEVLRLVPPAVDQLGGATVEG